MNLLAAIDLGSTSLKARVYDLDGRCVASASRPTKKVCPSDEHTDWMVWEPDQIWQDSAAATKHAVEQLADPRAIRAVAVTGMGMDGLPVDESGNALYPFISWHDPRTVPQAQRWEQQIGAERSFKITGFPVWPIMAAMRMLWLKEHEPEIFARTAKWLMIEDFLNHRLCGVVATDYSMASCTLLFDQARRTWSDELLAASGIDADLLPRPLASGTVLGAVRKEAAAATGLPVGTPVVLGGHDHLCGTLPAGSFRSGAVFDVIGTWESVIATVREPLFSDEVRRSAICIESHVAPGMYAAWGGAPAGEALEWYRGQFDLPAETTTTSRDAGVWNRLLAELTETRPGASGVMFLPHISAAGCPINDSRSRGAFVGITNASTRADMLRAVIEGINFQFLHIVRTMERTLGRRMEDITVGGGAVRNAFWIQNKADIIGVPLKVLTAEETSSQGAAILAGLGVGLYDNLDEAYERTKQPVRIVEPQHELTEWYADLFEIHQELYPALRPVNDQIFARFHEAALEHTLQA